MPWQKNYDETYVLEAAMRAFWAQGYAATSINDLVNVTGINRGSIYAAFDGKHRLFLRELEHYDQIHRAEFLQQLQDSYPPREAIVRAFEAAAGIPRNKTQPRGCLLVNTALELSPHDPEVRRLVNRSLDAVKAFFRDRLEAAKQEQPVDDAMDPQSQAETLLGLFLGLRVLNRSQSPRAGLNSIVAQVRTMLK